MMTILDTLKQSLDHIVINANRNIETYQSFGYPVIKDIVDDFAGPLAGIQTGLASINTPYAFVVPCDAPTLNMEVLKRLASALEKHKAEIAVAETNGQVEPVIMLIKAALSQAIEEFLHSGQHKTSDWVLGQNIIAVDFSDHAEWFTNINTEKDKEQYF